MRIRIKIIEKHNGSKVFIPQAKDSPSFFNLFLSLLTLMLVGRSYYGYKGLMKIKATNFSLLDFKDGEIIQTNDEEATKFTDYDSARDFLQEYIKQERLAIYKTKEEALKAKIAEDHEKSLIKGEKIKKVKYIDIKNRL